MSSTESSGAPAEATATSPASNAAPAFGSTRGSGLARGKRPSTGPVSAATAASTEYTPTAIEVVSAPREYQNPFAAAEAPAAAQPEPIAPVVPQPVAAASPAAVAPAPTRVEQPKAVTPVENVAPIADPVRTENDEPAELNILEPEQPKTALAQTWESEGFRPARESRNDRPRREDRTEQAPREERTERAPREDAAPFDPASIPEKFLYVRPGYNYVPTPSNYGGAPRENRESRPAATGAYSAPAAAAPAKSAGFFGWLKSLFGGSPAAPAPVEARSSEPRYGDRHRGGRGRSQGGGDGQHRRSRGGRGRSQSRGEYRGGDQGGSPSA